MTAAPDPVPLRIKKYPNRRFYDATRSRHVTLDDLYHLVRDGHRIVVTDADGRDITNVVLTQIILEHDPRKLDLFPANLMHQALQANQQVIRRFIEDYFAKAMEAFISSRSQFEEFLQRVGFASGPGPSLAEWFRGGLGGVPWATGVQPAGGGSEGPPASAQGEALAALRGEVEALRDELSRLSQRSSKGRRKRTKPATKQAAGKEAARRKRMSSKTSKAASRKR